MPNLRIMFAALALTASSASAQGVELVSCRLAFPDFAANDEHWIGAFSAYANWLGLDRQLEHAFQDIVNHRLQADLKAMGNLGYLVEFHVQSAQGTPIPQRELLYVELHGVAPKPIDALVDSIALTKMRPSPSLGYVLSDEDSYFIWLKRSGKTVKAGCIGPPASSRLGQDAGVIAHSDALLKASQRLREEAVYHELALTAQGRAASQGLRNKLAGIEADRQSAAAKLSEINANLAKSLDAEKRGKGLEATLSVLQGVLTVVPQVQLATATLNDPAVNFSTAKTPDAVVRMTNSYSLRAGESVVTLKKLISVQDQALADAIRKWQLEYRGQGIPDTLMPRLY